MEIFYEKAFDESFAIIMASLKSSIIVNGFNIVHIHDMKDTFSKTGLEFGDYSIVEICRPDMAHKVLSMNKRIGIMMPKKILIFTEGGKTIVNFALPQAFNIGDLLTEEMMKTSKMAIETMKKIVEEINIQL